MKLIALTQGYFAKVSDTDFEWLSRSRWNASAVSDAKGKRYARRKVKTPQGKWVHETMSRTVMGLKYGDPGCVDHIDGDTLNNQRENLRITTRRGNCQNRDCHRAGKPVGCRLDPMGRTWNIQVGGFKTMDEAKEAYLFVIAKYFPVDTTESK